MSYEDFILWVLNQNIEISIDNRGTMDVNIPSGKNYQVRRRLALIASKSHYLTVKWYTGGISGGSCWNDSNDSNYYSSSGNPPEELHDLDTILEQVKPDLSFLQYKKLTKQLVKTDNWSVGEYYGNSSEYMCKYIDLRDLYNYLRDYEWLPKQ